MRTLKLHVPDDALPPVDTFVKQTQEARVLRRAQAGRDVVQGPRLHTVADTRQLTDAALRTWVQRLAPQGPPGRIDRPRSGRPPTVPCARARPRQRLVDQDPGPPGALHAPC